MGLDVDYVGTSHASYRSSLTVGNKEKLLSVLLVLSASLSILAYDRLMLVGLSSFDTIASFTCAMQPFLPNQETSRQIWAVGNHVSCNFLGYQTQLKFAAMLYNGALSYYFLLAVRFGWKGRRMARYEPPLMHFSAILFPLVTASLVGAAFGVFHELEAGFGCWTADYPEGCQGDQCTSYVRDDPHWAFVWFTVDQ